jgi:hypothetical protein
MICSGYVCVRVLRNKELGDGQISLRIAQSTRRADGRANVFPFFAKPLVFPLVHSMRLKVYYCHAAHPHLASLFPVR